MNEESRSVDELLEEWADGTLSESEVESLRDVLRNNPVARKQYVQWQMMSAACSLDSVSGPLPQLDHVSTPVVGSSLANSQTDLSSWRSILFVAASVALCAVLARWVYLEWGSQGQANIAEVDSSESQSETQPRTEATARGIALVTRLVDATWSDGNRSFEVGEALSPGRLKLDSGYAQIEFFCGASVVLEGPAEMELVSSTSARFLDGRLRAQVPPAARGFQIDVDGMKVVDLGTEFGLSVTDAGSNVQVFDGEVELHRPNSSKQLVSAGEAFQHDQGDLREAAVTPNEFVDLAELDDHAQGQIEQRFLRWKNFSKQLAQDKRLIAYYAPTGVNRWKRKLKDVASKADGELDGAIVGAKRVRGRWPEKGALEFKQPGDRVRVNIPGEFGSLTFVCWVKIDSLDRWYNSLFLTDNYQRGEPHWQILDTGQLFFSVGVGRQGNGIGHKVVLSNPFWDPTMSGKWLHIATTYDVSQQETTHYLNGKLLHQETIPDNQFVKTTRIGMASIGNWSVPTKPESHFAIRNLNGSMDEFAVFQAALSADEIAEIYENGKP